MRPPHQAFRLLAVTLAASSQLSGCAFPTSRSSTISPVITGVVRYDVKGKPPIEDAVVAVYRQGYSRVTRTDAKGRYVLSPILHPDPHRLFDASAPGYWPGLVVTASANHIYPDCHWVNVFGEDAHHYRDFDPLVGDSTPQSIDFLLKPLPPDGR